MRPPRVLVADGHGAMRSWLRAALTPLGVVVRVASSGERALKIYLLDGPFDLVVADVGLLDPGGLKLVELTRSFGPVPTPFILISDQGDEALRRTVSEMGDAQLLDKPFDEGHLQSLAWRALCEGALSGGRV